ncbi:MAG TPA: hypothetical protein VG734_26150 [Lacunisphaera sp.]|nr:hypothetical protein [Lacunisphaera sp.]
MTDLAALETAMRERTPLGQCPLCEAPFIIQHLSWSHRTGEIPAVEFMAVVCTGPAAHTMKMGKSWVTKKREEKLRAGLRSTLKVIEEFIGEDGGA